MSSRSKYRPFAKKKVKLQRRQHTRPYHPRVDDFVPSGHALVSTAKELEQKGMDKVEIRHRFHLSKGKLKRILRRPS